MLAVLLLAAAAPDVTISIVGTNDQHGRLERVAVLGGYVNNLRAKNPVVLVDAGDVFQGTLESNLGEGAAMIEAMNAVGYDAAALGNHEFDFGPAGERATAKQPGDDPQGALKQRLAEAKFPFLTANVVDAKTGAPPAWPNLARSRVVQRGRFKIGVVGGSTMSTPTTTIPANFAGLKMLPLAEAVAAEAKALRAQGVHVVVAVVHAGGKCGKLDDPNDLSSCAADEEGFAFARALPKGLVDVVVGGHTHQGVAHTVGDVAFIESFANGRAFGRVDVVLDGATGAKKGVRVHRPQDLCTVKDADTLAACAPGAYEGAPVAPDPAVVAASADDVARAAQRKHAPLGVVVARKVKRSYEEESPLGNLFADALKSAVPGADVGLQNGGGIRADLDEGPLTYGDVYEVFPFDNRLVVVRTTGGTLRAMVTRNLSRTRGAVLSLAGVRVVGACGKDGATVRLVRDDGRAIADDEKIVVATNDFLASGGDGFVADPLQVEDDGRLVRDVVVDAVKKRGPILTGDDASLLDPKKPRVQLPVRGALKCPPVP